MALRTLHPCRFQFEDHEFRRVGNVVDGGTSLAGISDSIETTGGGYRQLILGNGEVDGIDDRATANAWLGLCEYLTAGRAVDVLICNRLFQPNQLGVHRHDLGVLTDGSEYTTSPSYSVAANVALRATLLRIVTDKYALPIEPGNLFAINHPSWGWRTYRIATADPDGTITFGTPLREAVAAGTLLDFENPRCRMYAPEPPTAPTNLGRTIACALTLVEDMRSPA